MGGPLLLSEVCVWHYCIGALYRSGMVLYGTVLLLWVAVVGEMLGSFLCSSWWNFGQAGRSSLIASRPAT